MPRRVHLASHFKSIYTPLPYCSHSFPVLTLLKGKLLNLQCARHLTPINNNTLAAFMPRSLTFMIHRKGWRMVVSAAEHRFSMTSCSWSGLRPVSLCVSKRVLGPDGNVTTSCMPPDEKITPQHDFKSSAWRNGNTPVILCYCSEELEPENLWLSYSSSQGRSDKLDWNLWTVQLF